MKKFLMLTIIGLVGFSLGRVAAPTLVSLFPSRPHVLHTSWASLATTVTEQAAEADVIVRVRVDKVLPARILTQELPPQAQKPGYQDAVDVFTDSQLAVTTIYKGQVNRHLTIMQTGGAVGRTDRHPEVNYELEGDPLFVEGSEHVLFLKNISGDSIHGRGREIYRIVNPAGRYTVQGLAVQTTTTDFPKPFTPPLMLDELVLQITQAVANP